MKAGQKLMLYTFFFYFFLFEDNATTLEFDNQYQHQVNFTMIHSERCYLLQMTAALPVH